MKSMQVFFVCALIAVCSAYPIPDEAAPSPTTAAPLAAEVSTPSAKLPESPAANVPVTDTSAIKSDTPAIKSDIPEPQALPSKTEDNSTPKPEEKKREIATEAPAVAAAEGVAKNAQTSDQSTQTQNVELTSVTPKASEPIATPTSEQPKTEGKPIESVKSLTPQSVQEPIAQASGVAEPKQAVSLVESTVVPAAIASEKKIDAEAPVPIVSENIQAAPQTSVPVEQELKSAPATSAPSVELSSRPSVESASSEKSNDSDDDSSSEGSSEESKEDKKTA